MVLTGIGRWWRLGFKIDLKQRCEIYINPILQKIAFLLLSYLKDCFAATRVFIPLNLESWKQKPQKATGWYQWNPVLQKSKCTQILWDQVIWRRMLRIGVGKCLHVCLQWKTIPPQWGPFLQHFIKLFCSWWVIQN